jgi:hypothetical protein
MKSCLLILHNFHIYTTTTTTTTVTAAITTTTTKTYNAIVVINIIITSTTIELLICSTPIVIHISVVTSDRSRHSVSLVGLSHATRRFSIAISSEELQLEINLSHTPIV